MYNQIIGHHYTVTGLINGLAEFFAQGLNQSIPCVAFLSQEHKNLLETQLQALGIDLESAYQFGHLAIYDSAETLAYCVSDSNDVKSELFLQVIGGIVSTALQGAERINVYHELDTELENRSPINAVMVNKLWRDLGKYRKFNLYKSYQILQPINIQANNHNRLLPQPKFA